MQAAKRVATGFVIQPESFFGKTETSSAPRRNAAKGWLNVSLPIDKRVFY
jgi:hypothetical protein